MGTYTRMFLGAEFKTDTPEVVIEALRYLAKEVEEEPALARTRPHVFFECERWRDILTMSSAYFPPSILKLKKGHTAWELTACSNIKNYDGEVQKFLAWIQPYVEENNVSDDGFFFVGFTQGEDNDDPTLIYFGAWDNSDQQKHVHRGLQRIYATHETFRDGWNIESDPKAVPVPRFTPTDSHY